MILVKKLKFFHLSCLSKMDRKKVFPDVVDKKEAFKDCKKNCVQKREIRIFPKGLVYRVDQNFGFSSTLIFLQNRLRKSIWERSSYEKVAIIHCNPL